MKRFFLWLLIVVASVVLIDLAFGFLFSLYSEKMGLKGDYITSEKMLKHFDSDLVVLGSSVALNSINTRTLEDSLKIKSHNGASNGQTFPYYLTMLKGVLGQHKPRKVILGILPGNLSDHGLGSRYNFLAPYYGRGIADIDSCMNSKDAVEPWLLKSNLYRLNTIWFRVFLYQFVQAGIVGENGFIAKPVPPSFPQRLKEPDSQVAPMSEERRRQILEFVNLCVSRGIDLTIVFTPRCYADMSDSNPVVEEVKRICKPLGVAVYDDSNLSPFSADESLFYDDNHVNINGSGIYTDIMISRLKNNDK